MGRPLLFLVSGMFIIFGIYQAAISSRMTMLPDRTYSYHAELQAANAANSAMDYAYRELVKDQEWDAGYSSDNHLGAEVNLAVYTQNTPDKPDNNITGWDEFTLLLYSEAIYDDMLATTEVFLRKDSFSKFSYFTNFEPSNIYFIWSDELSGPVHTNGRINIAGDPTFYGMVTSPEMWHGHSGFDNEPNFFGGSDFNAPERQPPSSFELNNLTNSAASGGIQFENEVVIEFSSGEELTVIENLDGNWDETAEYTLDLSLYNGIISSSEPISLKGTIEGSYTVHSEQDITITGDLQYNTNPIDDPSSTDLLGIVGEKNVIIADDAHQDNGSSDLTIHASIMALDKSFSAENYNSGGARGDLNLLGGIIQEERGPMGTFSGGSIQSGFNKQYVYDERLMELVPPEFPRESIFSLVHWITNTTPYNPEENEPI